MGATFEAAEKVIVLARPPGAATSPEGRICTVKPAGSPVTESVIAALKVELGVVVNVRLLDLPAGTLIELAEDTKVNVGTGATETATTAVCFAELLAAATVAE